MLAPTVIRLVQKLLNQGRLSHRKIAQAAQVSRGTVNRIASGKRPAEMVRRRSEHDEMELPAGPPERCPQCGSMVLMPCRACRTRHAENRSRNHVREMALLQEPLGLDLRPAHQKRYEEVRARREHQPNHR